MQIREAGCGSDVCFGASCEGVRFVRMAIGLLLVYGIKEQVISKLTILPGEAQETLADGVI